MDRAIWLAGLAPAAVLESHIADPVGFVNGRWNTVIGLSDQVPVWTGLGLKKQLYLKSELKRKGEAATAFAALQNCQDS